MSALRLVLACSMVGCGVSSTAERSVAPPLGEAESAVVGGRAEPGYPPVGYLIAGTPQMLSGPACGATLIAPDVAVSAAHCVRSASAYGFELSSGVRRVAKRVYSHPDYQENAPVDRRFRHDLAVLILESPILDVAPATIGAATVGELGRYVGYGRTSAGPLGAGPRGVRKSAQQQVTRLEGTTIRVRGVDGGLCWGDSGGPLMAEGQDTVYGVLADFDGEFYCRDGNAMIFTSLAAEMPFIQAAMACGASTDPTCVARHLSMRCTEPDAASCSAQVGCSWYACAQACAPSGTLVKDLCPDAYCAQLTMSPSFCAAASDRCTWHACSSTCWSHAATPAIACAPGAPTASSGKRFCTNECYLYEGHATNRPELADGCAEAGDYAQGNEPSATPSCWKCFAVGPTAAGSERTAAAGGWTGGLALPVCSAAIEP